MNDLPRNVGRTVGEEELHGLRDLLFKAKCDKNERDVFGISWMDARSILKD